MEEADQCSSIPDCSFSNKQTLHRSLYCADNHLPKSPRKKAEVIKILVEKHHVKIPFTAKRGKSRKDLTGEEKKKWVETFLSCSDVSYTNPRRKEQSRHH